MGQGGLAGEGVKVWCVIVHGLFNACHECDGGGDCEVYFVAAPAAFIAKRMVLDDRVSRAAYAFAKDDHRKHADIYPYKAFPVRDWRGKTARFLKDAEVMP
jgi:hypothetical protein